VFLKGFPSTVLVIFLTITFSRYTSYAFK